MIDNTANAREPRHEASRQGYYRETVPLAEKLGYTESVGRLKAAINRWIEQCDSEMHEALRWQFLSGGKYYRPVTIFACRVANGAPGIDDSAIDASLVVEIVHNMTLVVDDILDKSRFRRRRLTLHCRFGSLRALMTSGYMLAQCYRIAAEDPFDVRLLSELVERLGVAECMQWRLRQRPLGVEDWRRIAGEDTGSMFEYCACAGTRDDGLRRFGHLLGLLYHGCDDVGDVRGTAALGGGGFEDLRDGILTLPAALAIRDPHIANMFERPGEGDYERLRAAFVSCLDEAESYLDKIANEARREAIRSAARPEGLLALVEHTRGLSVA